MFDQLAGAVRELDIPVYGDALAEVIGLRDRLDARIALAVAAFEHSGQWELEGATSMTAWLRDRAGVARRDAGRVRLTGRRLHELPALADAARSGRLTGGQVQALVSTVSDATLPVLQDQEADLVPILSELGAADTATVLAAWQTRALALVDGDRPEAPARAVFLSETFGGRWEGTLSLDPLGGGIVDAAMRAASTWEPDDTRGPAERRADGLVAVCQWFLDHRTDSVPTRNRPHVHLVLTTDAAGHPVAGRLLDGPDVPEPSWRTLACDCVLHRVVHQQASATLDYGRGTRTISTALRTALSIRDRQCRFPGCDRPTPWCDAHHVQPWEHGGETNQANLVLLCSRHHHLVHQPGWHAKLADDATLEVVAPSGTLRSTHPPGALVLQALDPLPPPRGPS